MSSESISRSDVSDWPLAAPDAQPPAAGTVRCWRVLLETLDDRLERRLAASLTLDERERAARFHHADDRRRSVAARAALRLLLGAALGIAPHTLALGPDEHGKPQLVGRALEFNVSHSGGVVLVALARGVAVGADVERLRPLPDRADLAARYFHPGEAADLDALAAPEADVAFFRVWTRKEAVAKALGLGLGLALDRYRVSSAPLDPALLIAAPGGPPAGSWSMFDLAPAPGHVGAIAAPARPMALVRRTLDLGIC